MPPLNICRVITRLPRGGIELRLAALLPRLKQAGLNVRLVCIHEPGELAESIRQSGIPVDLVRLPSRLSPGGIRALARYFREHNIDIVHAHMYRSYIPATIAARLARSPVMLGQVHNTDTWENWRQLLIDRLLVSRRTGMIAVSERVREDICQTLGVPMEFVHILYNGIDVDHFHNVPIDLQLKQEFNCTAEDCIAVVVARLHPQKNHRLLFDAIHQLGEPAARLKLIVVGDGSQRDELHRLARELHLENQIRFAGKREDIERFYKIAHFSILPSDKEGFSNTILESMAAGCPVLATDVGGNREAVINGAAGIIVPPANKEQLAAAIKVMIRETDMRKKMAEAAIERARIFSLEAMTQATLDLYSKLYTK